MIQPFSVQNVYFEKGKRISLFTKNLTPKTTYFGERTRIAKGVEFRQWDPTRSKLAAALLRKVKLPLQEGMTVLYLGSAHGYTPSFLSDIIGKKGWIICVDPAPRVMQSLMQVTEKRNLIPLLEDANHPENYPELPKVDMVYMDVAQKDQVGILVKNLRFLKRNGVAVLMLKSRSIDATKQPREVYEMARKELEKHVRIVEAAVLEPFEKDHCCYVLRLG
ncbi:MAG: fibrillarin-like rRNA/tRNA 2'-O-methyltransferase [Candidatus Woesearchaeota archaeon]